MPDEIYEIIALAARYWFLFLMVLIAWRSYRWYARDRKKYKKRLKLLPDAGYIGELVVAQGDEIIKKGTCLPVGREGVLGYLRSNDVCLPVDGVANRHLWFLFDDTDGFRVAPLRGRRIVADGQELTGSRMGAFLSHGSTLTVGQAKLRLRMFSGFEYAGEAEARRKPLDETDEASDAPEETAQTGRVRRMHEIAQWQAMLDDGETGDPAYNAPGADGDTDDGQAVNPSETDSETEGGQAYYPPETGEGLGNSQDNYSPAADRTRELRHSFHAPEAGDRPAGRRTYYPTAADDEPYDSQAYYPTETEGEPAGRRLSYPPVTGGEPCDEQAYYPPVMDDDSDDPVLPPLEESESGRQTQGEGSQVFYPPVMDGEDMPPMDPAAVPKSLYVGEDEAETAKRVLWDRYFKGGKRR